MAPPETSPDADVVAAEDVVVGAVGSAASYWASSEAKSEGNEGACGVLGAPKFFTTPTCASLA